MAKDSIPKSKIPEALNALRALGTKELDEIPARAAIKKMRRQIERVLRLGYSYQEVSETLAGLDINISAERIRYLLNDIKKSSRKKSVTSTVAENTSTQVVDESGISENSVTESSNSQSATKSQVKSQPQSKSKTASAKAKSNLTTTPKKTKQTDELKVSSNQNNSGLAFQPELIRDEDL
ncbi:hypothetical protein H6G41_28830 [Tolypothrix sp. FACHB-123]|uniref:hypothetical protein n=1 Tax=Tolypothrix sp. FACHB-123 TaxID=2692868 RepID=UPI0016863A21|nr:hypothetical protein [Tolypothrix sp. FACHB-123]MBD2358567.1 hypothetical protein [Tolypothrix sp. FACHB-123]